MYFPSSVYGGKPVLSKVNTSPLPLRSNCNKRNKAMASAMPSGRIFRRIIMTEVTRGTVVREIFLAASRRVFLSPGY